MFVQPDDLSSLGALDGSIIRITTQQASIRGIAHADTRLLAPLWRWRSATEALLIEMGTPPDR